MKHILALFAIFALGAPALAAEAAPQSQSAGHWVWLSEPSIGPRAAPPTRHHVWVSDRAEPAIAGTNSNLGGHYIWVTELSLGEHAAPPSRHREWVAN